MQWIAHLQNHRYSSRFTDDVLGLVLDKMLVIESARRSSARDILRQLTSICENVNSDDSYVTSKEARGLAFDDEAYWASAGYPSSWDGDRPKVRRPTVEAFVPLTSTSSAFSSLTDRETDRSLCTASTPR